MLPDPDLCNNSVIRRAARRVGQLYDDALAPSGLRATQFGLLARIQRMENPSLRILATELVMDLSALGHTLKPLIRDGYVELVPDELDRRAKRVSLTEAGVAKLAEARGLWEQAQARFEDTFGADRAAALRAMLSELASGQFENAPTGAE